jgi:fucose permease
VRAISVLTIAALASDGMLLMRRARAIPELRRRGAVVPAAVLASAILGAALVGAVSGTILALQSTLLLNLARPMLAFTFVLRSIDHER